MIRGERRENAARGLGPVLTLLQGLVLLSGVCGLLFANSFRVTWPHQAVIGVATLLIAMSVDRGSSSYLGTLTLIFVSVCATFRYGWWRVATVVASFHSTGRGRVEGACVVALLLAEGYAAVNLLLGYMQTLWPLRRMPAALPDDSSEWPSVDLLIPTLHEPLSVVRSTALAAANIDWPEGKLHVYILDDGDREEFRMFAQEAGIGYLARDGKRYGKAGNLNASLREVSSQFVAVFDCDHVPTRSFLQTTVGWFLRDARLGMLQTPRSVYSPDSRDRNEEPIFANPNHGELFYGIVQDGKDFWNSALFRGSSAVLRRSALDEIGGFAQETPIEDVHTSLRMQMGGWNTAYINIPQAAGLAAKSLDDHIRQRIRWAQGMVQILRIDNPLFARGLTLAQRLCYFHAMSQFLSALPRLIFLAAPLAYLILGSAVLPGPWMAILAFGVPHLLLSKMANSRIQGQYRPSFWSEILETVLAPYIVVPTLMAVLRSKAGRSEAKPKGGAVPKPHSEGRTAMPFFLMATLQLIGLGSGAAQLLRMARQQTLWPHPSDSAGVTVMYMVWAGMNLAILGICAMVVREGRQGRGHARLVVRVPVDVIFADGRLGQGLTAELSSSAVALCIEREGGVQPGEQVQLIFRDGESALPASVMESSAGLVRAQFDSLTLDQEEALTVLLYSRADTWLTWSETRKSGQPFRNLANVFALALRGFWQPVAAAGEVVLQPGKAKLAGSVARAMLVGAVFLGLTAAAAQFRSAKRKTSGARAIDSQVSATPRDLPGKVAKDLAHSRLVCISLPVSILWRPAIGSFRSGRELYHASELSPFFAARAMVANFPWVLAFLNFAVSFLLAVVVRGMLRRRARARLLIAA